MTDTQEIKKQTYTDRLCECFEFDSEYTTDSIIEIIKSFQKAEYEKKKADATKMPFGRYEGRTVIDVAGFDKTNLLWLIKQKFMTDKYPELKANIELALKLK